MEKTKTLILALAATLALAGCDNSDTSTASGTSSTPHATPQNASLPPVKALPFATEKVALSDMFKNDLKLGHVEVGIEGGTSQEWAATGAAIAEKVATFGADSVEVSVRRSDIKETRGDGTLYREVAHVFYSPNPLHSVWDGQKPWAIYAADAGHLATQKDVDAAEEFEDLNQKFIDKGMDTDAADKKAGAIIAKKYHLSKGWMLPLGNVATSGDGIPRDSMNIDTSAEAASLAALTSCMDGKIIRMVKTCNE